MNFCENCNIVCHDERCPKCGRKRLRPVQEDDFCFVTRMNRFSGDILKSTLESENIECVLMPYGTGVRSQFAMPLESYLLYVRYKNLDYVRQLIKEEKF